MTFYEQMVPLNSIRQAKVHKSLIPLLYTVRLYLVDGTMIKFRISKKVYGFATQEKNSDNFLTKYQNIHIKRNQQWQDFPKTQDFLQS